MEDPENLTTASDMQGAHNTPCRRCGKINWTQMAEMLSEGYPLFECQTEGCDGVLWSD